MAQQDLLARQERQERTVQMGPQVPRVPRVLLELQGKGSQLEELQGRLWSKLTEWTTIHNGALFLEAVEVALNGLQLTLMRYTTILEM